MSYRLAAALCAVVPATAIAAPAELPVPDPGEVETSYRAYTLSADAVGLGLFVAAALSEGAHGRDTTASESLLTLGLIDSLVATPVIHLVRGNRGRAVGSFFLRWGLAATGSMLAVAARSGCHDGASPPRGGALLGDDFLCELDYVGYGVFGGLVVASVIDASFMTGERAPRASWTPVVAAHRDAVRVGAAWTW